MEFAKKIESFPAKLGITTGLFYFIQYLIHAASYLYASQCIRGTSSCPISTTGGHYSIGDTHIVFAQLFLCTYSYIQLAVNLEAISSAIDSSKFIYQFINNTKSMNEGKLNGLAKDDLDMRIRQVGAI